MTLQNHKLALITGASSGLGKALAHALSLQGIALILTGRDEVRLQALAKQLSTPCRYLALDLSQPDQRKKLIAEIEEHAPDLIINNAGFGLYGDALKHPAEQLNMIDVNITALVDIALTAAHTLIDKKKTGVILNVSSAAAFFSYPTFAVYAASKAFVLSFSEAFDKEISPHGVRSLTVCPGQIDTAFRERASGHFPQKKDLWTMSVEKAAKLILNQIENQKTPLIIDWRYRMAVFFARLLPKRYLENRLKNSLRDRYLRQDP